MILLACMLLGSVGVSACNNTTPPAEKTENKIPSPTPENSAARSPTPLPSEEEEYFPEPSPSPDTTDLVDTIPEDEMIEMIDSLWGRGSNDKEIEFPADNGEEEISEQAEPSPTKTPTPTPLPSPTPSATAKPEAEATEAAEASPIDEEAAEAANTAQYKNGFYTATGGYNSPAGSETVEIELAIDDDKVINVNIIPQARNETSQRYQQLFAEGIGLVVIGKELSEIGDYASVNGSSLTPGGFDRALRKIRDEAKL